MKNNIIPILFLILVCNRVLAQESLVKDTITPDFQLEKLASFPGGLDGWKKFLMKNLNAELPIINEAPAGKYTVMVQFKVCTDGTICDIEAKNNPGYGLSDEAVRVVKKSGTWVPAEQKGRKVKTIFRQPITFFVEGESKKN